MSRFIHAGEWILECHSVYAAIYADTQVTCVDGRAMRGPAKPKLTLYLDVPDPQSSSILLYGDLAEAIMQAIREGRSGLDHLTVVGDSALEISRVVKCQTKDKPRALFRLRNGRFHEVQFLHVDLDALIQALLGADATSNTTFPGIQHSDNALERELIPA